MRQVRSLVLIVGCTVVIIITTVYVWFVIPERGQMGEDYTQLDSLEGTGTNLQKSNSMPGRYMFFESEGELGIAYGGSEVAFVNVSDSVHPEVLSLQSIESDGQYANSLLGINNGLAYFNIAYRGAEILDISEPSSPHTFGLIKEYGTLNGMSFAGGAAVTTRGIIDISDYAHPVVIEHVNASAVLGHGNAAVFATRDSGARIISYLVDPRTISANKVVEIEGYGGDIFPMGALGDYEFMFATRDGDDLMVLAVNSYDGSIKEIEDIDCFGFHPIAVGDRQRIYVGIGVPKYKETLISMLSFQGSSKLEPRWTIGLGISRLVRLKAREGRVAFMTVPVDERGQSQTNPTVDIHVLDARSEGLPQYIGGLKRVMFIPDFELVGDALYIMGKEGIEIYSLK